MRNIIFIFNFQKMDDDNLFSDFDLKEQESNTKKDKSLLNKKRKGESVKSPKIEAKSITTENEELKDGQNLENIINEKMDVENDKKSEKKEEEITELIEVENFKKDKEFLKNQIIKVYPEIDEALISLKNTPKLDDNNKNKKIINDNSKNQKDKDKTKTQLEESISNKTENTNIKEESQSDIKQEIPITSKITFDYEQEKEKYDNLISDKDIQIEKENFEGGYHETIYIKGTYDSSKKIKSFDQIPNPPHQFPFELDEFQKKSILCLESRESVLVSAHTSAGKTVVAQYAIAMAKRDHQRVIYTSPIKALSNQKYRELKELFGDVGLMTGDVTRNENASCIVMTTEILRNMLFKGNEITKEIAWVIFDEVHYMRDRDRGVVWEETIILLSNKINYVFLSATIPNAREFGMWITKLKKQPCNVVYTSFRPTPLRHYLFPVENDNSNLFLILDSITSKKKGNKKAVEEIFHDRNFNQAFGILKESLKLENCNLKNNKNKSNKLGPKMSLIKLIKALYREKFCPVIVFSFSKRECETNALDLYKYKPLQKSKYGVKMSKKEEKNEKNKKEKIIDFNTDEEKENIEKIYLNAISKLSEEDQQMPNIKNFLPLLQRGIGVHHGGMLPILKELVELLFQEGLIKVLFSTETFSMGINMPAKTVVFTTLRKFDGEFQRYLGGGEYTQMAGRAGRRGIDDFGNVIIMVDKYIDQEICEKIIKGKSAPLISSFQLSYNQLANLMRIEGLEPDHILSQSFRQFQKEKSIPILKTKLAKIYNQYLLNSFNNEEKEAKIREIYELEETLKKLKSDFKSKIFVPKYITKYLCLGRIVKLKYFGYGIVINCKVGQEIKLINKENSDLIIEYNSNKEKEKEENILSYNEEDLYLKHIGFDEEINSALEGSDNTINNNNGIVLNKRSLRNKEFVSDTISNTHNNNQKLNSGISASDSNRSLNSVSNNNQEIVLDVLVSLKNHADVNGCLCPGNFEESFDTFYGIIPFTITMIEEIYEIRAKMVVDLKDQKLVEDYGIRLKEIIKRMNGKFPVLDIIKLNKIEDPEIIKLSNKITDIENKYNTLKNKYNDKYTNTANDDLNMNLKKYVQNKTLEREIKKIITKIESCKHLVLNSELTNMKRVMRRLDFVTKDETLTPKGQLICDISGVDEIVTAELLFSGFFKDMTLEEIGASIYCCLSKENTGKKEDMESMNNDFNAQKKIKKIYEDIIKKVNYIADILEECKIFDADGKKRYIEGFNDNYMMPMYKWISGYKFNKLIAEYYTLYEGNLIRVIRRVEEFVKSFETSVEHIGDYNLKKKLGEMHDKIKRDLPFASSLYLE